MNISIIIVNYNTPSLTLGCVESIYNEKSNLSYEIIIVDNNSIDSGQAPILKKYPEVIWIQNNYNAGFGRANNEGLNKAKGDVILFLNSDTIIMEGSITNCYNRLVEKKETVAAGVQLLNQDGSRQDSVYDQYYWTELASGIPYFNWIFRYPLSQLKRKLTKIWGSKIGYLVGAFLMVKKEALNRSGFFDEDFFLYAEETELCLRLRNYGNLECYDDLFVYHLIQGSKTSNTFHYGQHQLSIQLFVRKQFGVIAYLFYLSLLSLSVPMMLVVSCLKTILKFDLSFLRNFGSYFRMFYLWVCFAPKIIARTPFLYKFRY